MARGKFNFGVALGFSVVGIFLAFCAHETSAKPADVLIRAKSSRTQLSIANPEIEFTEKQSFDSIEEKQNFIENFDSENFEFEDVVQFSGDDVTLQQQAQQTLTTDPLSGNQWALFSAVDIDHYRGVDIDALRAWNITRGSKKVVIFVMDSGVDTRDPDLAGRVVASFNALNPGQASVDENGHGTHVTSIATASGDNNYGIRGVVPGDVQVVDVRFLNGNNQGDSQMALAAVQFMERYMAEHPGNLYIGSNSWGGDVRSSFLEDAMKRLAAYDYLPITSAGNHSRNNDAQGYYPCTFTLNANTCVAASNRSDARASFSGYGPGTVHLFAPGDGILGIIPGQVQGGAYTSAYEYKSGTSQAVPFVTGVAALIWSINPKLKAKDVQQVLVSSVDRLPGAEREVLSGGRLNAYRALLIASGRDPSGADRAQVEANSDSGGCSIQWDVDFSNSSVPVVLMGLAMLLLIAFRLSTVRAPSRNTGSTRCPSPLKNKTSG